MEERGRMMNHAFCTCMVLAIDQYAFCAQKMTAEELDRQEEGSSN